MFHSLWLHINCSLCKSIILLKQFTEESVDLQRLQHLERLRHLQRLRHLEGFGHRECLRHLQRLQHLERLRHLQRLRHLEGFGHRECLRHLQRLRNLQRFRHLQRLRHLEGFQHLESPQPLENFRHLEGLRHLQGILTFRTPPTPRSPLRRSSGVNRSVIVLSSSDSNSTVSSRSQTQRPNLEKLPQRCILILIIRPVAHMKQLYMQYHATTISHVPNVKFCRRWSWNYFHGWNLPRFPSHFHVLWTSIIKRPMFLLDAYLQWKLSGIFVAVKYNNIQILSVCTTWVFTSSITKLETWNQSWGKLTKSFNTVTFIFHFQNVIQNTCYELPSNIVPV